ncbi:hypothetical protein C1D09_007895 [Mesorhizobium intechi]|uniref:hypothetical protein n=1 Tax=Mesorhizobium intechi TaxID=537601 RepID=UPI000CAD70C2|nr:hypothetical protein [Mesorhizobium intechi]TSE12695.1 hypothetical protein C1D09_007895 [Mesorhizobium intechi]
MIVDDRPVTQSYREGDVNGAWSLNAARAWVALLSLFALSGAATACSYLHDLDLNYISNAQIVVRARVASYQPVFDPGIQERRRRFIEALGEEDRQHVMDLLSERSPDSAHIKFEVTETIFGSPQLKNWEAAWVHSTFIMPEQWTGPENVIVGLRAAIDRHGRPFVQVVQQPCAPRMILEDSPENRKAVADAIIAQSRRHAGYAFQ